MYRFVGLSKVCVWFVYGLFIVCLFGDKDKDSVNTFFFHQTIVLCMVCVSRF